MDSTQNIGDEGDAGPVNTPEHLRSFTLWLGRNMSGKFYLEIRRSNTYPLPKVLLRSERPHDAFEELQDIFLQFACEPC